MINFIGLVASSFFAILFIGLGLPLFFNKIKRNYFYGYRISQYAMLDDDIWYAVNHQGGKHLIIIGALLAGNSLFAWMFLGHFEIQSVILNTDAVIMVLGFVYSIIKGRHLNNELARAKGLKNHIHPQNIYKIN
jgi:hypothetical protein